MPLPRRRGRIARLRKARAVREFKLIFMNNGYSESKALKAARDYVNSSPQYNPKVKRIKPTVYTMNYRRK